MHPENAVFEAVYDGKIGQRIQRRGGLQPAPSPRIDGARRDVALPPRPSPAKAASPVRKAELMGRAVIDELGWVLAVVPVGGLLLWLR